MMRIRIERRGGVVGRPAVGERDESALSPAARAALRRLLDAPPRAAPPGPPNQMRYKIRVEDENGVRELDVPETEMPDELADIPEVKL